MKNIQLIFIPFSFLLLTTSLHAQENYYVTVSTQIARPLAMGGAFIAVRDNLPALGFNPGAFHLEKHDSDFIFKVFLNPASPLIIGQSSRQKNDWEFLATSIIQGFYISYGRLSAGFTVYNESCLEKNRLARKRIFDGIGLLRSGSTIAGFSLALAPGVSIGMSGELYRLRDADKIKYELGYQYGVYIKMKSHLDIGLSFIHCPDIFNKQKTELQRLSNETLNVGVAYSPWTFLKFSFDVRNVSNEEQPAVREPHFGLEFSLSKELSIRGGFFKEKEGRRYFSSGLGLNIVSNTNSFNWKNIFKDIRLDTTLIWERDGHITNRWFILTSSIGI